MKFLKSLFGIKVKNTQPILSWNFTGQVKKAIEVLGETETPLENEEILKLFVANGIEYCEAVEIFLFLPIAFVRHLLPTVKWYDSYIDYINEQTQIEKKFSETESYQIIRKITSDYFMTSPESDKVLKIAGRSAEFQVINKALLDNLGAMIEDIKLSQTVILR